MSAWKKNKISSSFSPLHSNICFLLRPSSVKWFPVTNCSNCQTQTLHICSFLPACLGCSAPGRGSACPAPQMDTELHHHPPAPQDSPLASQNNTLSTHSGFITYFRLEKAKLSIHGFEGCGCLFGLTPHVSVSQILRPFVQGVGSLL